MAKSFAPRISKKMRKKVVLSDHLDQSLFKLSDEKLLKGAKLTEIFLKDVVVKDQVRTKFNDHSIQELAGNIKINGLIQPLVLHRQKDHYTLICGERRFRAMTSIKMVKCPCFVLENKTDQELMAIQFSENSSREQLHFVDKADGILNYQISTKASERKIQTALGISKSEVHRSLIIAKLPKKVKEAAKLHNIEKYVLLEWSAITVAKDKKMVLKKILAGEITKRVHLKKALSLCGKKTAQKKKTPKSLPANMSANALLEALQVQSSSLKLDKKTKNFLKDLVGKAQDARPE